MSRDLNLEDKYFGVSAPVVGGTAHLTGSTTSKAIKVPTAWLGTYGTVTARGVEFEAAFSTGSAVPSLTYGAASTVAADGSITFNALTGDSFPVGVPMSLVVPKNATWFVYVSDSVLNMTGSLKFRQSDSWSQNLD